MANLFNLMPLIYLFPIQWGKSKVRERYDGKAKSGRQCRLYHLTRDQRITYVPSETRSYP